MFKIRSGRKCWITKYFVRRVQQFSPNFFYPNFRFLPNISPEPCRTPWQPCIQLKYAWEAFPDATLYGKVDDDVYVCGCQMYSYLHKIAHGRLYFGWLQTGWLTYWNQLRYRWFNKPFSLPDLPPHFYNYHDEMFVLIGRDLVKPIVSRPYCYPTGCTGEFDITRNCEGQVYHILYYTSTRYIAPFRNIYLSFGLLPLSRSFTLNSFLV